MINGQLYNTSNSGSAADSNRSTAFVVIESCIFVALDLAAFAGNSLISLAFYRNLSLRTVANYFVLSLALTDLSMAVIVMPLSISGSIANKWVAGDFGCKPFYIYRATLAGTSLLTVMLLAVNRYLRVTRPDLYSKVYSKRCTVIMAVSVWIVSIIGFVLVGFLALIQQFRTYFVQPSQCFELYSDTRESITTTVERNIGIAVPSIVIVVCYVKIWRTIRKHRASRAPTLREGQSGSRIEEVKVTRILTFVVIGLYLCWLPVFVSYTLSVIDVFREIVIRYWNICYMFPLFISSVITYITQ